MAAEAVARAELQAIRHDAMLDETLHDVERRLEPVEADADHGAVDEAVSKQSA